MQIDLLDTFLDLVETRSFNRSADRLGVTQSTVSARVVALEEAIGARLFVRSRAGTELSTEGLRFEPHARLLRQEWNEARHAVAPATESATLRLGIQNDLAAAHIGELVAEFRRAFPQMGFYIEPDYSTQMCADLVSGAQDFALLFTPKPHPDLYFQSVGEVSYRLISSDAAGRAQIDPATCIVTHFSPAFAHAHRQLLPELTGTPLSVGQSATVVSLLQAMGGTGFVLVETAEAMVASGRFQRVADVPDIGQPIYAAMHLRHRISKTHRRLVRLVGRRFSGRSPIPASAPGSPDHAPAVPA
ncbi:MAG: LysR family transcriptional regulator [Pseudomonadota bacterium]